MLEICAKYVQSNLGISKGRSCRVILLMLDDFGPYKQKLGNVYRCVFASLLLLITTRAKSIGEDCHLGHPRSYWSTTTHRCAISAQIWAKLHATIFGKCFSSLPFSSLSPARPTEPYSYHHVSN
jgi:hypothetical protein